MAGHRPIGRGFWEEGDPGDPDDDEGQDGRAEDGGGDEHTISYPGHSQALGPIRTGTLSQPVRDDVNRTAAEAWRNTEPWPPHVPHPPHAPLPPHSQFEPLTDPYQQLPHLADYDSYLPDAPPGAPPLDPADVRDPWRIADQPTGLLHPQNPPASQPSLPSLPSQPGEHRGGLSAPPPGASPEVARTWHDSAAGKAARHQHAEDGRDDSDRPDRYVPGGHDGPGGQGGASSTREQTWASQQGPLARRISDRLLAVAGPLGAGGGGGGGGGGALPPGIATDGYSSRGRMPPGGPGALAAQIRMRQEEEMAVLHEYANPYSPITEPLSLTSLVRWSHDPYGRPMRLPYPEPGLSDPAFAHWLGFLSVADRILPRGAREPQATIRLSPRLFPQGGRRTFAAEWRAGQSGSGASERDRYASIAWAIDESESAAHLRLVLGELWVAWYCYEKAVANALNVPIEQVWRLPPRGSGWSIYTPLVVAFAPVTGRWQPWHGRFHTYLWQQLCRLLAPHAQLDALTAEYVDITVEDVPPLDGIQRREMIYQASVPPYQQPQGRGKQDRERATALRREAWSRYVERVARQLRVPRAIASYRLSDRDRWQIKTAEDAMYLTDLLCEDSVFLTRWRQQIAQRFGCRDEREIVLWLAEPATTIPELPKQ